MESMIYR